VIILVLYILGLVLILGFFVKNQENLFRITLLNISNLCVFKHSVDKPQNLFKKKHNLEGIDLLESLSLLQDMMIKDLILHNLILLEHSTIGKQLQLERVQKMQKIFYKNDINNKCKYKMQFIPHF
jgi:hypothetical protein